MEKSEQLLNSKEPLSVMCQPLGSEEARTLRLCYENGVKLKLTLLSDHVPRLTYEASIKELWEEDGQLFASYSTVEALRERKTAVN